MITMNESDEAVDIGSINRPTGPRKRTPLPRMHSPEQNADMPKNRSNSHYGQTNSRVPKRNSPQKSRSPKTDQLVHDRKSSDEDTLNKSQDSVTHSENLFNSSSWNTSSSSSTTSRIHDTSSPQKNRTANYSYEKSQKNYKTTTISVKYNSRIENQNDDTRQALYKTESHSHFYWIVLVLLALITAALCSIWRETEDSYQKSINYDMTHLTSEIKQLRSDFPSQDESMWLDFLSGMKDTISGDGPSLFLLLAIEEQTANCLAKKLAKVAQKTLNGEGELILNAEKLGKNIEAVMNHTEDIKRSKAVIVLDLLSVEPEALRGLHWLCDSEHPAVKEAAYFMTMKSDQYDESTMSLNYAEQQLTNTMSNFIHEDVLAPLVTRITAGMVIPVRPEEYVPCSHPRY